LIPPSLVHQNFLFMEAVAAVGVAAAAVQFFEVAAKALKTCSEIRQSAKGESKHNEDLGKYVHELQQIQASLNAPLSGSDPQTKAVVDIRQECSDIAKELLLRLEKVQQRGHKGWRTSMQATFRTMHESKNIKEVERRYQACQRKLQEALSVEMRNAVVEVLQSQGKTNDTLRKIVLPEINTRFDQAQASLAHKAFLDSLFFPDMFARHRTIAPPSKGTYEWVFDQDKEQDDKMQAKLGQFKHWLSSDEPCFWINGKPGSGKSSLMSFIESDKRTEDALKIWSGSHELYIFSFFFWRPGSDLQKSITGLLQSLLYQLVKKKSTVMSAFVTSGGTPMHIVWTETTLLRAIAQVLSMYHDDHLFLLVDGLDEFEGQYVDLVDTLFKLRSGTNIKSCLSSRPEAALVNRLSSFPSIRLQDINSRDINVFVKQCLEPYQNQSTEGNDIIRTVGQRSEGIFLWAVLVCKSLASGYEAGDDKNTIQRRLDAIPKGLEPLFSHMFSNIEDVHRESLSVYFSLLKWNLGSVALATVLLNKPFETLQQYADECRLMKHRIISQSKGLIEVEDYHWRRYTPDDSRWALVDISTGKSRTDFVHESELTDLAQYDVFRLRWVHRSAHDCILDSPNHDLAASLKPKNENDLARKALNDVVWLSKHIPQFALASESPLNAMPSIIFGIEELTRFLEVPGVDLSYSIDQALDELYNTLITSLYTDEGRVLRSTYAEMLKFKNAERDGTFTPLLSFWIGLARYQDPDRFILPRFERLEQSGCVLEALAYILRATCLRSWDQLPVVWQRAIDVLIAHPSQGLRVALTTHLPENLIFRSENTRHHIASFLSNGKGGEACIDVVSTIGAVLGMISCQLQDCNGDLWRNCILQLFEVSKVWDIYLGHAIKCRPGFMSPLQVQVPQHYAYSRQLPFLQSHEFQKPRRAVRLLFLDHKQLVTRSGLSGQSFRVAACFHISEKCLKAMDGPVIDEIAQSGHFPESMGEERCLQLIMNDIWEDSDEQLDAWQRLYVRACVRKWFKYLWAREAGK